MKSLMQQALGDDWQQLPPALQAHYRGAHAVECGHLDIDYPRLMQPVLSMLRLCGVLVHRRGRSVPTRVEKNTVGTEQHWRRTIRYPDRPVIYFNSRWRAAGGNQLIEFVNPLLGLKMAVHVAQGQLHYRGVCFVIKLGPWLLPVPEWLLLGHSTIVEQAIDETRFNMDFRITHPWLGQVFCYRGVFETGGS